MKLFEVIVGSQAYGTATPQSDTDLKSVFHASPRELLGAHYKPQIEHSKDNVSYELKRYLELLKSANPTILEMLYSPEDCIVSKDKSFNIILAAKNTFLTRKCKESFGGYAAAQIRKARGLTKKFRWEKDKTERKEPIDFCYLVIQGKTRKLTDWLQENQISERQIGLVNLDHAPHCYAMYIDWAQGARKFQGIFAENSDYVNLSSIPKGEYPIGTLVYNRDSFQKHRTEYRDYQTWLKERNEARYVDNAAHGQKYDSKNMLHVRRLLDMAIEIGRERKLQVRRPNCDYLLQIRKGEADLESILKKAEEDIQSLEDIYKNSDLPDEAPDTEGILLNIRYSVLKGKIG